jgi:hypothetical protein
MLIFRFWVDVDILYFSRKEISWLYLLSEFNGIIKKYTNELFYSLAQLQQFTRRNNWKGLQFLSYVKLDIFKKELTFWEPLASWVPSPRPPEAFRAAQVHF